MCWSWGRVMSHILDERMIGKVEGVVPLAFSRDQCGKAASQSNHLDELHAAENK